MAKLACESTDRSLSRSAHGGGGKGEYNAAAECWGGLTRHSEIKHTAFETDTHMSQHYLLPETVMGTHALSDSYMAKVGTQASAKQHAHNLTKAKIEESVKASETVNAAQAEVAWEEEQTSQRKETRADLFPLAPSLGGSPGKNSVQKTHTQTRTRTQNTKIHAQTRTDALTDKQTDTRTDTQVDAHESAKTEAGGTKKKGESRNKTEKTRGCGLPLYHQTKHTPKIELKTFCIVRGLEKTRLSCCCSDMCVCPCVCVCMCVIDDVFITS